MIRSLIHNILLWTAKRIAYKGIIWPFRLLVLRAMAIENPKLGSTTKGSSAASKQYTLLALTPGRFRGDLEALEETGIFQVIRMPKIWQPGLVNLFLEDRVHKAINVRYDYEREDIPSWVKARRDGLRLFLGKLLTEISKKHRIDGLISAAVWYPQDVDWARSGEAIGIPYFSLHKEGLVPGEGHRAHQRSLLRKYGHFCGTQLIVQNKIIESVFLEAEYVKPEAIKVLGSLRMDEFIARLSSSRDRNKERKQVAFFSFERAPQLGGLLLPFPDDPNAGMPTFFRDAHVVVCRLAKLYPDVHFIIKPKWGGKWVTAVVQVLKEAGLDPDDLPNVEILPDANAHDIIFASDVVCGFGSTVLLEAGITDVPVIMPFFAEAKDVSFRDHIKFLDRDDLFDIARSAVELEDKIKMYLQNPGIGNTRKEMCRLEFENFVSPLSGNARSKYAETMASVIEARRLELSVSNSMSQSTIAN